MTTDQERIEQVPLTTEQIQALMCSRRDLNPEGGGS